MRWTRGANSLNDRLTLGSIRSHVLTGPEVKEKLAPRKDEGVVESGASAEMFIADADADATSTASAWLPFRFGGPDEWRRQKGESGPSSVSSSKPKWQKRR